MALEFPRCSFVVGQKVVCIDDTFGSWTWDRFIIPVRVPMLNEILTITGFMQTETKVFLLFREIDEIQVDGPLSGRIGWEHTCFRPLITRKTDISQFEKLLDTTSVKELV